MTSSLPTIPRPVDVTDERQFPNIAASRAWLASLPDEQRNRLMSEWEER